MIVLIIALFVICLYGIRVSNFHTDYMGKEVTTSVKGVFAALILLSHIRGYLTCDITVDRMYVYVLSHIGQLMVAMFFFYSGYGIWESFRKKQEYIDNFFRKRIVKTLLHFDFAVFLFLIEGVLIDKHYPLENYILCWTGWESIGNSNWFIFDILVLYLVTFIVLREKRYERETVLLTYIVTIVFVVWSLLLISHKEQHWWYDTVFCFPVGMLYSYAKNDFEKWMHEKGTHYFVTLVTLGLFFMVLYAHKNFLTMSVVSPVFCLLLVIVSMKVQVNNRILYWLGVNAFSIYILQRLPMNALAYWGFNDDNLKFTLLSILSVMVLSPLYTRCMNTIDKKLFV